MTLFFSSGFNAPFFLIRHQLLKNWAEPYRLEQLTYFLNTVNKLTTDCKIHMYTLLIPRRRKQRSLAVQGKEPSTIMLVAMEWVKYSWLLGRKSNK